VEQDILEIGDLRIVRNDEAVALACIEPFDPA
jgi:hypothetical protein